MPSFDALPVLTAIAPVFVLLALGMASRWSRLLPGETEDVVLKLVVNLLYPCLVFDRIIGNESLRDPSSLAWAAGSGLLITLVLMAAARLLAGPLAGLGPKEGRGTFGVSAGIQNYGFFAIPVLVSLYPKDHGAHGLLFVHSIGVELAMWTFGVMLLRGSSAPAWRSILSIPVLAIILALILNALSIQLPTPLQTAFHQLGAGAIPLGILLIGFTTAGLLRGWKPRVRVGLAGVLIRLCIAPAVYLGLIAFLPMPDSIVHLLIVQAAMPAAIFPIVLARLHGGNPLIAVEVAATTTLVSLASMPLTIYLGQLLAR